MALKKGSFRMMHRNQWRWCRANKIRGNTLLVLLAIETGPWGAGQYTGLFHLAIYDISDYTGLTEKEVDRAIDQLERPGVIVYDRRQQVVFVRGMLPRQSPSFASSENNLQGVSNHVERMPEGSLAVLEFIKAQVNIPELYELLEGYLEGEAEGEGKGTSNRPEDLRPEDLKTLIPEDLRPEDKDTVNAVKSPALTPSVQPSSSSPTSTPDSQIKGSPLGSSSTSTPGKATATAKASGKGKPGNGHGLSTSQMKEKGLAIVAKKYKAGEWDIFKVSNVLTTEYSFTKEDINSREVMDALGLWQGEGGTAQ